MTKKNLLELLKNSEETLKMNVFGTNGGVTLI